MLSFAALGFGKSRGDEGETFAEDRGDREVS